MHSLNTFLIEDSAVIREHLVAALEELAPIRIQGSATNQAAAVAWLAEPSHTVDLVLIDLFLAGGSGLGVLRALAKLPERPALVVLTNFASPDMRRYCLSLGALRVFDKSSEIDDLLEYCNELASRVPARSDVGAVLREDAVPADMPVGGRTMVSGQSASQT